MERTTSQQPLRMVGGQDVARKMDAEVEGMDTSQNGEDEGREPYEGSGCSGNSDARV